MSGPTDPTADERACDWCNKPASEATDLTTMWWADYECCSMECAMRAEGAAQALQEAADELWDNSNHYGGIQWGRQDYVSWLRDRAARIAQESRTT